MTPSQGIEPVKTVRRFALRGLRLQHRIVVPFVIVAVATTAAAAWVALSETSGALHVRLQSQLVSAAAVISRSDLAVNPAILETLHQIVGAHIITFDETGQISASSALPDGDAIVRAASRAIASRSASENADAAVVAADCDVPCLVAFRPVESRPGTIVALVAETSELSAATRAVARAIVLAGVLSLGVMVLVSQTVVRRVTAPLDRLVRFVREVSPHGDPRRAEVSHDEVGAVAEAFNGMLDRLDHSREALVRSEKLALAGLLAARVAHDIRNPLSSIKMEAQLLRARLGDDAADGAALTAVLHDVNQVEAVIGDLLELARPGELKPEPTAVNDVIRDALAHMSAQFRHRKIAVDAHLSPGLPVLQLDQRRVRQALLNVFANASEAMPTGGELIVTSRAEGGQLLIEVCDDGVGVDPAVIDRVFDPFVSTKREGVGLGLVNAKAVVEGHGGHIALAPRHPRGACATISLPVGTQ